MADKEEKITIEEKLSLREFNLIKKLREIPYGEVVIFMKDKQPIRIVKARESVEL